LADQFAAHSADRRYLALVWGRTPALTGTVDAPLGRHATDRLRFAVRPDGRRAVTHWQRLAEGFYGVAGNAQGGVVSLVRCRLETGRTHQVRVHLTHLGLPLLGDPVYAPRRKTPGVLRDTLGAVDHQLLHAARLGLDHPATGLRFDWRTPPPADFLAVAEAVGLRDALMAAVADDR
jgi:23S rRNA pseudouridine1911/1915/1917 synthase